MNNRIIYDIDPAFDIELMLCQLFNCKDLSLLHALIPYNTHYSLAEPGKDQHTLFHQKFYDALHANNDWSKDFFRFYHNIVRIYLANEISEDKFYFQKIPTFRVHLPGNKAVGGWHRDRDYNHQEGEINFWLPFTEAFESNTIFTESKPGKQDFDCIPVSLGQIFMFDGLNCMHGNIINRTEKTRVSMDFRVLPASKYKPSDKTSIAHNVKFVDGEYYVRNWV